MVVSMEHDDGKFWICATVVDHYHGVFVTIITFTTVATYVASYVVYSSLVCFYCSCLCIVSTYVTYALIG